MGNRLLAEACHCLGVDPRAKNLESLWALIGFEHLVGVEFEDLGPVHKEIANVAGREFARRAEAEKVHLLDDGTEIAVRRKDRTKPTLLTQFMLMDHGPSFPPRYFFLRPTKGWRWERTDAYEAREYRERGVKTYDEIPNRKKEIRKRKVA